MGNKIISIFKFIFFLLLLPFVITCTISFVKELYALQPEVSDSFVWGVLGFFIVYLFIWEPQPVYQYGQNLVVAIFRFFSPLVKVAPFLLPIYSILALILFYFATLIFKSKEIGYLFMFSVGFTLAMHMVFTAKILRSKDSNAVKPNYFFAISLIYVINIFIITLMLDVVLSDFSFPNFFHTATGMTGHIYKSVFKQLFVP